MLVKYRPQNLSVHWIILKNEPKVKLTLQHILKNHRFETLPVNAYQKQVLQKLVDCKTQQLGGHWQVCTDCGQLEKHYHSCGNRHCPQCQGANRERWILEREFDLFDVPHYHVTFTIPRELRGLFYQNQKLLYDLLFRSMWDTLCSFSKDPRSRLQAQIGVIAVLHTWTQQLEYHPHLHCIVPAGGLTADRKWKSKDKKFLFNVKNLSTVFKTKFCQGLKKAHSTGVLVHKKIKPRSFDQFINGLLQKKWVVNSKPGFVGKSSVIEYLGRYTHKIAISNYRLISLKNGRVYFSYRDRRAGDIKKVTSLPIAEFIQRFSYHILPKGYIKIRHYGLFSTRTKKVKLAMVREALQQAELLKPAKLTIAEVILQTTGCDIHLCKQCKQGRMVIVQEIPPARGSPFKNKFKTLQAWT